MVTETLSPTHKQQFLDKSSRSTDAKLSLAQDIFNRLTCFISLIQFMSWHANFFRPSKKRLGFAIKSKSNCSAGIIGLSRLCLPKTIKRPIFCINITSLNSHVRRTLSHIFEEILKIMPALANYYSSAAIIFKSSLFWVIASPVHSLPNSIGCRLTHAVGSGAFANSFGRVVASAGSCMATSKITGSNLLDSSAFASTEPFCRHSFFRAAYYFYSRQKIKYFTNFYWNSHGKEYIPMRIVLEESK